MVQCDGVDNRRAKSDAVPTLLERKRRDMEVKVVMTGTTVQGHDRHKYIGCRASSASDALICIQHA